MIPCTTNVDTATTQSIIDTFGGSQSFNSTLAKKTTHNRTGGSDSNETIAHHPDSPAHYVPVSGNRRNSDIAAQPRLPAQMTLLSSISDKPLILPPVAPPSRSLPVTRRNSSAELNLLWSMEHMSLKSPSKEQSSDTNFSRSVSNSHRVSLQEPQSVDGSAAPHQFNDKFLLDDDTLFTTAYSRNFFPTAAEESKTSILKRRESYSAETMHQQQAAGSQSSLYGPSAWSSAYNSNSKSASGAAGDAASGISQLGNFSALSPQKQLSPSPFGMSNAALFEKLKDTSFYPPKPATLAPSYSSPDLGAFRTKNNFGGLIEQQEQYMMMQQNAAAASASAIMSCGGDLDSASIPGSYGICRYFLQGYCSRGDRCNFAHIMNMSALSSGTSPMMSSGHHALAMQGHNAAHFASGANTTASLNMGGMSPQTAAALYGQAGMHGTMGMMYPGLPYGAQGHQFAGMGGLNALKFHATLQRQKKHSQEEASRFSSIMLEELVGQLSALSKDQHGCRYLQRKLEEQCEASLNTIYAEIFPNFAELMTDPFGNYLCQKILEYCTEEQRNMLVEHVAPDLAAVSLNMHGTRAVQKLIEFVTTHHQISTVVRALGLNVVSLIKDLNGNHVIQKCLNRMSHENTQFIYNAVRKNCIEVATHRHGCCVLQRCIDHASEPQRVQLVAEITFHALALVQDPFGNYVVQYVLDLTDIRFSEAIIHRFLGNICLLSVQKFSSNVIEKCIRVASPETRALLINELLNKERLDKLLRDSYANYVVQTSLDYAEPSQRAQLVECIRPILPSIRNTPYGKRIQTKIFRDHFGQVSNVSAGLNALSMLGGNCYNDMGMSLGHSMGSNSNSGSSFSGLVGMNNNPLTSLGGGMNAMF
ncbi:hypothetical protein BSLG_000504 [Batrachochytrium salamandrivorans]|nr:hypothetical protein BSLG_000504 [Batrachochytrium salamandrivorans]